MKSSEDSKPQTEGQQGPTAPSNGAQHYRYIRTGTNHWSMAFTYDCLAWQELYKGPVQLVVW